MGTRIEMLLEQMVDLLFSGELLPEKELDDLCLRFERFAAVRDAVLERYFSFAQLPSGSDVPEDVERRWAALAVRLGLNPDLNHYRSMSAQKTAANETPQVPDTTGAAAAADAPPAVAPRPIIRPSLARRRRRLALRAAAVLIPAMIVGGYFWYGQNFGGRRGAAPDAASFVASHTVKAERDSVLVITLPDDTEVTLNRNATFSYNDHREGELRGEAYFKIAKDPEHPFVIHSDHVDVTVLGTEFNFRTQTESGGSQLSLYTGIVELKYKHGTRRLDVAGNEFSLDHSTGAVDVHEFDSTKQPDWIAAYQQGLGIWSLGEIFDMVEARYGVRIMNRDAVDPSARYTFSLDGADSVESVMRTLETANGLFGYTIDGTVITLDKKQQ